MKEFPSNFSLEEMLHYGDFPRQLTDKCYELIEEFEIFKTKSEEDYNNLECEVEYLSNDNERLIEENYNLGIEIESLEEELEKLKENQNE